MRSATALRTLSLLWLLPALTACTLGLTGGAPNSELSLDLARKLHAIAAEGFTNGEISEPDTSLSQAFNSGRTDAAFTAKPDAGLSNLEACRSMAAWVQENLQDPSYNVQYNGESTDFNRAASACATMPRNWIPSITFAGLYEGTVVQVVLGSDGFLVNVDGTGATLEEVSAGVADPKLQLAIDLIESLPKGSSDWASEADVTNAWQNFAKPAHKMDVTWNSDEDGKVHFLHFDFGRQGLLPFCTSIEPWNGQDFGADPGAPHFIILQEDFSTPYTFASAVSGDCP